MREHKQKMRRCSEGVEKKMKLILYQEKIALLCTADLADRRSQTKNAEMFFNLLVKNVKISQMPA